MFQSKASIAGSTNLARRLVLPALLLLGAGEGRADPGRVGLRTEGTNMVIEVQGDADDDWRIQISGDLVTWSNMTALGTLLSGESNAPARSVGGHTAGQSYYRAVKTEGLYDPSLFRTVSLTFTQAGWQTLLANGRTTGLDVYCSLLTLDNGATNYAVGARYKGNTSYSGSGTKKSINLEMDYFIPGADLMTYGTVNLNNAAGDETIMREALYFTVMSKYTPCPRGAMARVHINGALWGVYSLVEQENAQLINDWFPSSVGDRWRAPNAPVGGFTSPNSAFHYFGNTNVSTYQPHYELKTTNSTTTIAFQRLINAIYVLNTTPVDQLRDRAEDVFAVDPWLWFLAIENIFVDDDSYWNKGSDYAFYYEPESGRLHPVEHDGNESFTAIGSLNTNLSPVLGATGTNRPLLYRFLPINELRQRYLAHMRTVLEEHFHPAFLTPLINRFHALSINAILADPNRGFTMAVYTNDLNALRVYVTNRYNFLINHDELRPAPPFIIAVSAPAPLPAPTQGATITAEVYPDYTNGLDSVWLYYRGASYGRFTRVEMFDDGAHGDGAANDSVFGAATTNYPAGTKVRYYVEARSANNARAASFAPVRAEQVTFNYRVTTPTATNTPVWINELMASNDSTIPDPQGEYDDWIELHNITDQEVDLTGRYLSDEPNNPRKWPFPTGTTIPPQGFLMVWADEDGAATSGLHASFKLSASGETIFLTDTDSNFNAVLDSVTFGEQTTDLSYGRLAADPNQFEIMPPTPGQPNN